MLPFLSLLPHSSLLSYHLLPPFFPPRKHTFHRYHFFSFFEVFDSLFLSFGFLVLSFTFESFLLIFLSRFFLALLALNAFINIFPPVSIQYNSLIFRLSLTSISFLPRSTPLVSFIFFFFLHGFIFYLSF